MKYTKQDFISALHNAGIKKGDLIMVHTGMSSLRAMPEGVRSQDDLSAFCAEGLFNAIGDTGTVCIPAFSYSLGSGEVFDPLSTPTKDIGEFPSYFWKLPGVQRSNDPFLSIAAKGPLAKDLLRERAKTSYGYGSFFDTFVEAGGKLVTIGVGIRWGTMRYYFVEIAEAPFRYMKIFKGLRKTGEQTEPITWEYSVAPRAEQSDKMSRQLGFIAEEKLQNSPLLHKSPLGRGFIYSIDARDYRNFVVNLLRENPWISGESMMSVDDIIAEEEKRIGKTSFAVVIDNLNAEESAKKLTPLPRYEVSGGFDSALNALASRFPLNVDRILTGQRLGDWVVPESWICRKAQVSDSAGKVLFDLDDNPLLPAAYSRSFSGEVSREELLKHIYLPAVKTSSAAIPYVDRENDRIWGICLSRENMNKLKDTNYKIELDTDFSFNAAKIGEWYLPGKKDKEILLAAYLDSPYQFNSGLSGVLAGLEVMNALKGKELQYGLRLLIMPRRLGLAGYFSLCKNIREKILFAMALDALATKNGELFLHCSMEGLFWGLKALDNEGNTQVCRITENLSASSKRFLGVEYSIPVLLLNRQTAEGCLEQPCSNWRSSEDTLRTADFTKLSQSIDWLRTFLLSQ